MTWRRGLIGAGIGLILVVAGSWAISELTKPSVSEPRWVEMADESGFVATCAMAAESSVISAAVVDGDTAISEEEAAETISLLMIRRHSGVSFPVLTSEIELVWAAFPDGIERLAWRQAMVYALTEMGMVGNTEVVYIDAESGEPLMVIEGIQVGDPLMVCGQRPSRVLAVESMRPMLPAVVGAGYVSLMVVTAVGYGLIRAVRSAIKSARQ